jgi:hypothetical protein
LYWWAATLYLTQIRSLIGGDQVPQGSAAAP